MIRLAIVTLALVTVSLPWPLGASPQKPVRQTPFHTDGGLEPPRSLADLVSASELVVLGEVTSLAAVDPRDSVVLTAYTITLLTVFKTDTRLPAAAETIIVQRPGGIRERPDHIEHIVDEDFPNFEKQGRYVLFLRYLVDAKYTPIAIKGNAAFRVTPGNTIVPMGNGSLSRSLAGTAPPALAAELLRLGGGR